MYITARARDRTLNVAKRFHCRRPHGKSASVRAINQDQTSLPASIRTRQNGYSIELGCGNTFAALNWIIRLPKSPSHKPLAVSVPHGSRGRKR